MSQSTLVRLILSGLLLCDLIYSQNEAHYERTSTPGGQALCAEDADKVEIKTRSKVECALRCKQDPDCKSFNFRTDVKLCQLFVNTISNYSIESPCSHYVVGYLTHIYSILYYIIHK